MGAWQNTAQPDNSILLRLSRCTSGSRPACANRTAFLTAAPAVDDLTPARPLLADVAPITGAQPGSFANRVLVERHPAIIKHILEDRPCDALETEQLHMLWDETVQGLVAPLPDRAWDSSYWRASGD